MKTFTLEEAGYQVAVLRGMGYWEAAFTHKRDKDGKPTGLFIVMPGELIGTPVRYTRNMKNSTKCLQKQAP